MATSTDLATAVAQLQRELAPVPPVPPPPPPDASLTAGTGIAVSGRSISNTGVLSLNALTGPVELVGTADQIAITPSGSTLQLGLPQDIATTSSPSFAGLDITGDGTFTGELTVEGNVAVAGVNYSWPGANALGILTNDGSGGLTWAAIGACATCVTDGGNSFGNTMTIGSNDAEDLELETSGTTRLTITAAGGATFTGSVAASSFSGNGSALTNLSANNVSSGTLAVSRGGTGVDGSGATDGQLLIGNGTGYSLNTLTPGAGISIGNAAGAITITNTGAAASCAASSNYACNGGNLLGATLTLGTNDANSLAFETGGTTRATFDASGNFLPNVDIAYDLGSSTFRWGEAYVGPDSLHIQSKTTDGANYANSDWGLSVIGNTADTAVQGNLLFRNNGASLFTFGDNGLLGIGTLSPSARVHAVAGGFRASNVSGSNLGAQIAFYASNDSTQIGFIGDDSAGNDNINVRAVTSTLALSGATGITFAAGSAACSISSSNQTLSCPGAGGSSERFGSGSTAAGANGLAVGFSATAGNSQSIAIGNSAVATSAANTIAIGASSNSSHSGSIVLGTSAASTAANQLVVGSSGAAITSAFVGNGVTNAAPAGITFNATGGSGTNIAGASITFAGGRGTGTGVGGSLVFQYTPAGSSGSSQNALSTACTISGSDGTLSCPGAGTTSERFGTGSSTTGGQNAIAIGNGAAATNSGSTALGRSATASGSNSVAVGNSSTANNNSVAIGTSASSTSFGTAVAIGVSTVAGEASVAIGYQAVTPVGNNARGVAIGANATTAAANGGIAIGNAAATTAANQLVIGSSTSSITSAFIGNGVTNAAPAGITFNATGSTTAGTSGAALTLMGGAGATTTTGSNGGALVLQGGTAGGTSARSGGLVSILGGSPSATGVGGGVAITAANGGATSGNGGDVAITSGSGTASNSKGGAITLQGGSGGPGSGGGASGGGINLIGGNAGAVSGAGGTISISAGSAGGFGGAGTVNITGGGGGSGSGGAVTITGGQSAPGATGGALNLIGGAGVGTPAASGGAVNITGGSGTSSGGAIHITSGASNSTFQPAGAITITGGMPGTAANGSAISITAGAAGTGDNRVGGALTLMSGSGGRAQTGGAILVQAGEGGATGAGGTVTIQGGTGGSTSGTGGAVTFQGGSANGTNRPGGATTIAGGIGTGSGIGGAISFQTSAAGGPGTTLNGLSTVASLAGGTGYATFQNTADTSGSFTAFRVMNAAGSQALLGIDTGANTDVAKFTGSDGANQCTVQVGTGWSCTSDERLKTNVLSIEDGLEKIMQLRGVTFQWLSDPAGRQQDGFIAQEVQQVLPELVSSDANGYLSLNKDGIMAYLVRAVQQQQMQLDSLKAGQTPQGGTSVDVLAQLAQASAVTINGHLITGNHGGRTTTATAGAAAGAGASVSVSGNDTAGTITVRTGAGASTGDLASVTFASAYGAPPRVQITPTNAAAGALQPYRSAGGTSSFGVGAAAAPKDSTTYTFDYFVVQ